MMKKKKDICEKHGEQDFSQLFAGPDFMCTRCLATSMYPQSPLCPVHHWSLRIKWLLYPYSPPSKQGYCKDCDKYYELCDVKVSAFADGRYRGAECIKLLDHQGMHKAPYGLEYSGPEKPKMDFEGGVFRRVNDD